MVTYYGEQRNPDGSFVVNTQTGTINHSSSGGSSASNPSNRVVIERDASGNVVSVSQGTGVSVERNPNNTYEETTTNDLRNRGITNPSSMVTPLRDYAQTQNLIKQGVDPVSAGQIARTGRNVIFSDVPSNVALVEELSRQGYSNKQIFSGITQELTGGKVASLPDKQPKQPEKLYSEATREELGQYPIGSVTGGGFLYAQGTVPTRNRTVAEELYNVDMQLDKKGLTAQQTIQIANFQEVVKRASGAGIGDGGLLTGFQTVEKFAPVAVEFEKGLFIDLPTELVVSTLKGGADIIQGPLSFVEQRAKTNTGQQSLMQEFQNVQLSGEKLITSKDAQGVALNLALVSYGPTSTLLRAGLGGTFFVESLYGLKESTTPREFGQSFGGVLASGLLFTEGSSAFYRGAKGKALKFLAEKNIIKESRFVPFEEYFGKGKNLVTFKNYESILADLEQSANKGYKVQEYTRKSNKVIATFQTGASDVLLRNTDVQVLKGTETVKGFEVGKSYDFSTASPSELTGNVVVAGERAKAGLEDPVQFLTAKKSGQQLFLRLNENPLELLSSEYKISLLPKFGDTPTYTTFRAKLGTYPIEVLKKSKNSFEPQKEFFAQELKQPVIRVFPTLRSLAGQGKIQRGTVTPTVSIKKWGRSFTEGVPVPRPTTSEGEFGRPEGSPFRIKPTKTVVGAIIGSERFTVSPKGTLIKLPRAEYGYLDPVTGKARFGRGKSTGSVKIAEMSPETYFKNEKVRNANIEELSSKRSVSVVGSLLSLRSSSTLKSMSSLSTSKTSSSVSRLSKSASTSFASSKTSLFSYSKPNFSKISNVSKGRSTGYSSFGKSIAETPYYATLTKTDSKIINKNKKRKDNDESQFFFAKQKDVYGVETRYTPTVFATYFNIRGKKSKILDETSGFGVRPI